MKAITQRSVCPVSCSLEVLGDKWTLLIVRDLLKGKSAYGDFLQSDEKIATNILADRLACLEYNGLVTKTIAPDKKSKFLYQLTEKGLELKPVLNELFKWGMKHQARVGN
jgi:DNA-binding HxlR family transcriptional regulator